MITFKELQEKWLGSSKHKAQGAEPLSNEEMHKIGNKLHDPQELSDIEKNHLSYYTGPGHLLVNDHLRGIRTFSDPDIHKDISQISNAIGKHSTKHDVHVWRSYHDIKDLGLKKGDIFHDKGFVSTSLRNNHSSHIHTHIMHIKVPKGSNAMYLNQEKTSSYPDEHEVLLQKGAKFKYHGAKTHEVPFPADMRNPTRTMTIHRMTYLGSEDS
jgi:hypothetical protein